MAISVLLAGSFSPGLARLPGQQAEAGDASGLDFPSLLASLTPADTGKPALTQTALTQTALTQTTLAQAPLAQAPLTQAPLTQAPLTQAPLTQAAPALPEEIAAALQQTTPALPAENATPVATTATSPAIQTADALSPRRDTEHRQAPLGREPGPRTARTAPHPTANADVHRAKLLAGSTDAAARQAASTDQPATDGSDDSTWLALLAAGRPDDADEAATTIAAPGSAEVATRTTEALPLPEPAPTPAPEAAALPGLPAAQPQPPAIGTSPGSAEAPQVAIPPTIAAAKPLAADEKLPAPLANTAPTSAPQAPALATAAEAGKAVEVPPHETKPLNLSPTQASRPAATSSFGEALAGRLAADGSGPPAIVAAEPTAPQASAAIAPPAPPPERSLATGSLPREHATSIPAHVHDPRWSQQLGDRVLWMAKGEVHSAQISITPAQLGPIQINISLQGDQMTAQFVSAHQEIRQVLEDSLPRLREMLSGAGINLGQANVGAQQQQRDNRPLFAAAVPSAGEDAILPADASWDSQPLQPLQRGRGMVDLFA